jgi:streptogramin lyase
MKRRVAIFLVAAASAFAFPVFALGTSAGDGVRISRARSGPLPTAGRSWTLKLVVRPSSFKGVVSVVATGQQRLTARAQGGRGAYRARLVFPRAGVWKLTGQAGGFRSSLGTIRVRPAPPLLFEEPTGIDVASDGSLLVVEFGRLRLVRVDPANGRVTQLATLDKPWGVAQAPSGSVFVSDRGSLLRFDGPGAPTTVATVEPGVEIGPVAVTPGGDVFYSTAHALYRLPGGRAGTPQRIAPDVSLDSPHGIVIASDGAVLVSDTNNGRILRIDGADSQVTTFATIGHPRGIDVARDGTVYVAAADEHRIVRLSASGQRLDAVGPRFHDPYALALASDGIAYAIEAGPVGFIRRIGPDGKSSVVAGR